jgi:hypothetical protein
LAMPTVHPIDEPNTNQRLTEAGQDGMKRQARPALETSTQVLNEGIIMNKQVIITAAIALLGSASVFAQSEAELQHFGAQQASVASRSEVRADVLRAKADLAVPSEVLAAAPARSTATRAQISTDVAKADLVTPTEVAVNAVPQASGLSRDAVRAEARAYARSDIYREKTRIGAGY